MFLESWIWQWLQIFFFSKKNAVTTSQKDKALTKDDLLEMCKYNSLSTIMNIPTGNYNFFKWVSYSSIGCR